MPRHRSRTRSPDDRRSSSSSKFRRRSRSKSRDDRRRKSRSKSRSSERKYSKSSRRSRSKSPPSSSRQYSSQKLKGKNLKAEIEITREKMRKSLAVASSSDSSSNFSSKQKSNLSNFQSGGAPKQDDIDRIDAAGFAPQTFVSHREDKRPSIKSEDGSTKNSASVGKIDSSHATAIFGTSAASIKLETEENSIKKNAVFLPEEDEDRLGADIFYEPAEIRWRQWAKRLNELRAHALNSTS